MSDQKNENPDNKIKSKIYKPTTEEIETALELQDRLRAIGNSSRMNAESTTIAYGVALGTIEARRILDRERSESSRA